MKHIITISREYGSGGKEIGRRLAEALKIPFYDKRLIILASKQSGLHPELFEQADEKSLNTFFYSIPTVTGAAGFTDLSINDKVFLSETNVIRELAKEGPCVIVGRSADYILSDNPNCINLYIHSDLNSRVKRAIGEYGIDDPNPEEYVKKVDKKRASYYKHYTGQKWGDSDNFHLTIHSDAIGVPNVVKLLLEYIKLKEQ